jgi:hypothetical protein
MRPLPFFERRHAPYPETPASVAHRPKLDTWNRGPRLARTAVAPADTTPVRPAGTNRDLPDPGQALEAFFAASRKLLANSFNEYLRQALPGCKL